MTIRELKTKQLRQLQHESDAAYDEWKATTKGLHFGTNRPLEDHEIFRWAFSKGVSAVLKRVKKLERD